MMKKKKKKDGAAATPSLKDCANCGAPEGKVYGVTVHRPCSKCGITYYCSVICQKHHWKEGGHKKHCVAKEERSASAAAATEKEDDDDGGAKPKKKPRDKDNECAVCLVSLKPGDVVRELSCRHTFHKTCIDNWLLADTRRAQQTVGLEAPPSLPTCPLCKRVPIPLEAPRPSVPAD